jgi:hypothetical protein
MAQGKRPDVDGLAALASWGGLKPDDFVRHPSDQPRPQAETMAMISTYLRADRNLTPDAADALEKVIATTYEHLRST